MKSTLRRWVPTALGRDEFVKGERFGVLGDAPPGGKGVRAHEAGSAHEWQQLWADGWSLRYIVVASASQMGHPFQGTCRVV